MQWRVTLDFADDATIVSLDEEPVLDFERHRVEQVSIVAEVLEALLDCAQVLIEVDPSWLIVPSLLDRFSACLI